MNDLPNSAFAYIEPGGEKDEDGKTTPRTSRHFAIHDKAHVKNALARLSSSPFGDKAKSAVHAAAKKFGIAVGDNGAQANAAKQISEMRASGSYKDIRDLLEGAVGEKFGGEDGVYTYISDFSDSWVVYEQNGEKFQVTYEVDGATVTLGDPIAVTEVHTYTPMETKAQEPTGEARAEVGDDNTVVCTTCDGDGKIKAGKVDCPDCNATGKVAKKAATRSARSAHRTRRDLKPRGEVRATPRCSSCEVPARLSITRSRFTASRLSTISGTRWSTSTASSART